MFYKLLFVFSLMLSVFGCTHQTIKMPVQETGVLINDKLSFELLKPFHNKGSFSLSQAVSIQYKDQQHNFIAQLELNNNSFKMVGVTSTGILLFTIYSDKQQYIYDPSPLLPESMNLRYLFADIQLTYWPVSELNRQLIKQNSSILQSRLNRTLSQNGDDIITIDYDKPDPWASSVSFRHLKRDYTVNITLLNMESL